MPDRFLEDTVANEPVSDASVQQLIESEHGKGAQGINRRWQASDAARVVLTSDAGGVKISRDNGVTAPTNIINDGTPAGGQLAGAYPNPSLSVATMDLLCPPGTIVAYGGAAAPVGWLLCDGVLRAVSAFPRLAAVLGGTYGGDGVTTFAVPNLVGRVVVGPSGSHPRGQVAGAESVPGPAHTHPGSHAHGMNAHTHALSSHTHALGTHTHAPGAHTHDLNGHAHGLNNHDHTLAAHTHAVDLDHNHGAAAGAATATATAANSILNGTGASTSVPAATHTHPVDLPALGGAPKTSDGPAPSNTSILTGAVTIVTPPGTITAAPSAVATGGPTGGSDGPSAADTGTPSTANTQGDTTAHPGTYTDTISTLQPYAVVTHIIRTGA